MYRLAKEEYDKMQRNAITTTYKQKNKQHQEKN